MSPILTIDPAIARATIARIVCETGDEDDAATVAKCEAIVMAALEEAVASERARADAAEAKVEAFQLASGLCVPAEEAGGDPGGVEPRHVERFIGRLERERDEALEARDAALVEMHAAHKQFDEARRLVEAVRNAIRADLATWGLTETELRANAVDAEITINAALALQVVDATRSWSTPASTPARCSRIGPDGRPCIREAHGEEGHDYGAASGSGEAG